ncbi:hypothetical protein M409DRAFT_57100 [Zasmidium cellare ATCC 36951]|uniref:Uncharacterized protein n=1 Tax=Zasmidium cellare ATCC 36951 TaxID=1080233 RepID=A0A6A6CEC0_ZASCE|nr:uncharacterized protein M409DRAFT_57100 [Zasmidium cellare ATCC 36951]KAF2163999.1 hypothetical protein M409DRAFT_57100 [Zasmidium cellare ATCC 36951]
MSAMGTSSEANSPTKPASGSSEGVDEEESQLDHRAGDGQDRLHQLRDEHTMLEHTEQVQAEPLASRSPAPRTPQELDEESYGSFSAAASAQDQPIDCFENEEGEAELAAALERLHHKHTKLDQEGVLNGQLDGVPEMDDDDDEWCDMHEDLRMLGAKGLRAKEVREVDRGVGRKCLSQVE